MPAAGGIVTVASTISNTPTLGASTMYGVLLNSSGALVVTAAGSLSLTNYAGTAQEDASGDRLLGWILTDSSSHIYNFIATGAANAPTLTYRVDSTTAPFPIFTGLSLGASVSKSAATIVPSTSRTLIGSFLAAGSASVRAFLGTSDGVTPTASTGFAALEFPAVGGSCVINLPLNSSQAFLIAGSGVANNISLYGLGYIDAR